MTSSMTNSEPAARGADALWVVDMGEDGEEVRELGVSTLEPDGDLVYSDGAGGLPAGELPNASLSVQRHGRRKRSALILMVVVLLAVAGGEWYVRAQHTTTVSAPPPATPGSDKALAARIGIQSSDLSGWPAASDNVGNVFATEANASLAAAHAAQRAGGELSRCLRVPFSAVNGAFGMGSSQSAVLSARAASPVYSDPTGGGITSSVVDVMRSDADVQADARVFANPQLFATCYQPFVQAMLPYEGSAGTGTTAGTSYATDTVQPAVMPALPASSGVHEAAFYVARIGTINGQTITEVTTAIAIYGGRLQATLSTVSDFVFPPDVQAALVHTVEIRVQGAKTL